MRATKLDLQNAQRVGISPVNFDEAMILARKIGHEAAVALYSGDLEDYGKWTAWARGAELFDDMGRFDATASARPTWLDRYDKYDPSPFLQC
jgi:hypothetical protein